MDSSDVIVFIVAITASLAIMKWPMATAVDHLTLPAGGEDNI